MNSSLVLARVQEPGRDAVPPGFARKDEPDESPRMLSGTPHQHGHVEVAAHDLVQRHDVGRLDLRRERHEVTDPRMQSLRDAAPRGLLALDGDVRLGRIDHLGALGPGVQQLECNRADPAADIEQRGALDALGDDGLDQRLRRRVRTVPSVALEVTLGLTSTEHVRAAAIASRPISHVEEG